MEERRNKCQDWNKDDCNCHWNKIRLLVLEWHRERERWRTANGYSLAENSSHGQQQVIVPGAHGPSDLQDEALVNTATEAVSLPNPIDQCNGQSHALIANMLLRDQEQIDPLQQRMHGEIIPANEQSLLPRQQLPDNIPGAIDALTKYVHEHPMAADRQPFKPEMTFPEEARTNAYVIPQRRPLGHAENLNNSYDNPSPGTAALKLRHHKHNPNRIKKSRKNPGPGDKDENWRQK